MIPGSQLMPRLEQKISCLAAEVVVLVSSHIIHYYRSVIEVSVMYATLWLPLDAGLQSVRPDDLVLIVYCVLQGVLAGSAQKLSVIVYHTTFPTHKMLYLLVFPSLIWDSSALKYD
jgi:hypothetical protein